MVGETIRTKIYVLLLTPSKFLLSLPSLPCFQGWGVGDINLNKGLLYDLLLQRNDTKEERLVILR